MINPDTAGIDIGSEFHFVNVGDDRAEKNIRRYGAHTRDLQALILWLKEYKAIDVASYDLNFKDRILKNLKSNAKNLGYELVEKTVNA